VDPRAIDFAYVRRGGAYYRVAKRSWKNPADTNYSKSFGGRWNEPDRPGRPGFGALYLNATVAVARHNANLQVRRELGATITIDDLAPEAQPDLQHFEIAKADFVDAATAAGIALLGLSASYPTDVPHPPCQGIAAAAYADGENGIVPLSALDPVSEELVIFDFAVLRLATPTKRVTFADWY
jgi:RES domain-containing protein